MKAVMYGAGNIGRGFIGVIFANSGYEVAFIDVVEETVAALQRERRYPVRILSEDSREDFWVEGVTALDGRNTEGASDCIAEADIMATAVGVRALPLIAPVIAAGLKKRFARTEAPLNIIICENLIDANHLLAGLIRDRLSQAEGAVFAERVGLVEASIGRMVPLQTPEMRDGNPLRVTVESYGFLPVDRTAFIGEPPPLAGLVPCANFDFYIQRKLFIHNMGHAICAYLGMLAGDRYIADAIERPDVFLIAQNAMLESALALSGKYNMPPADLLAHIRDLLCRFANRALGDTCARVGADTERKLGLRDRLLGAIGCCTGQGIVPAFISAGIAAALFCHLRERGLAQTPESAAGELARIAGLGESSPEVERPLALYRLLAGGGDIAALRRAASAAGRVPGVV
ncbi:MAG: mannitol-1-phosphate 5-dehydrogenase [Spirochaetaceae bacterium]|jgi:mannitol-1-phosphate 5-dehydrogenase|nr:mannitol-1-phosphate 5-dehydrogenase [Spirochaetaceae bacterium]